MSQSVINWSNHPNGPNGPGIFNLPKKEDFLDSDITLRVQRKRSGKFLVIATGEQFFPSRMNCTGEINISSQQVFGHVDVFCCKWEKIINGVTDVVKEQNGNRTRRIIHEQVNLNGKVEMKRIGFELAKASHQLQYHVLYEHADSDARQLFDRLFNALRKNELTIKVIAEDFFIPWSMLYLGDLEKEDAFDWNMFVGARHIVDHLPNKPFRDLNPKFTSSSYFNVSFAHDIYIKSPTEECLLKKQNEFFSSCASANFRIFIDRADLEAHVRSANMDAHLIYFFCHGQVTRDANNSINLEGAKIELSDREPIKPEDFSYWRSNNDAFKSEPFIFLNACQAAQPTTLLFQGFIPIFFKIGAKCLIGPQISVPAVFAADYAQRLLEKMLTSDTHGESPRLGSLVRDLTKDFIDQYHNPLGLIYGLHGGTDVRFKKIAKA